MAETLDIKLARKVMRNSQARFDFLIGLEEVLEMDDPRVRASPQIASVDVVTQFELARTGVMARFIRRKEQLESAYLNQIAATLGSANPAASPCRSCLGIPLGEIQVVPYELGRYAIGPAIPEDHLLYDERDWLRGRISLASNYTDGWQDTVMFLNLVELNGDITLADRIADTLQLEDIPGYTDVYDLTARIVD